MRPALAHQLTALALPAAAQGPPDATYGSTITCGCLPRTISMAGTVAGEVLKDAGRGQTGFGVTSQNPAGSFRTFGCYPSF